MNKTLTSLVLGAAMLLGPLTTLAASQDDYNFPQWDTGIGDYVVKNLPVQPDALSYLFVADSDGFGKHADLKPLGYGLKDTGNGGDLRVALPFANSTTSVPGLMTQAQATQLDAATAASAKAYEGSTLRSGAFPIFKSATVSSGTAVVNLTDDGTSGGNALCTNGVIADSVNPIVSDATASYQMSWAFTNSNKTLTVTANKLTTANILTGILGQSAANSSVVKVQVWCY